VVPAPTQPAPPQSGPDAACVARCQAEFDRSVVGANALLKSRQYSNASCPGAWDSGVYQCSIDWQSCTSKCKGPYDNACFAPCNATLQTCCHSTALRNAGHAKEVCLQSCPPATPRLMGCVQPAPAAGGAAGGAPASEAPWTALLKQMNAMASALGPRAEGLDLQQFNNVRRNLAFMQVSAELKAAGRKFAVVSGGSGRLWVVLPGARSVLVDADTALALRGLPPASLTGDPYEALAKQTGLDKGDVLSLRNTLVDADNKGASKPGDVFFFPEDSIRCWQLGSSEHGSVRGTINGTGDFI